MIFLENVPKTGIFIVTVYSSGGKYQNYFLNEGRKTLTERIPRIDKKEKLGLDLELLQFCTTHFDCDVMKRVYGVQGQFGYKNMTPEKFKTIYKNVKDLSNRKWCDSFDILVGRHVEGLD